MRHKLEMDTIGGEEVAVERYANGEWELNISGYDGFTMMSLDEMKHLIEGIQAMITSAETKGECNVE